MGEFTSLQGALPEENCEGGQHQHEDREENDSESRCELRIADSERCLLNESAEHLIASAAHKCRCNIIAGTRREHEYQAGPQTCACLRQIDPPQYRPRRGAERAGCPQLVSRNT